MLFLQSKLEHDLNRSRAESVDAITMVYSEKCSKQCKPSSFLPELLPQFWKDILALIRREAEVAEQLWPEDENVLEDVMGLVATAVEVKFAFRQRSFACSN